VVGLLAGTGDAFIWNNASMKTADPMFGKRLDPAISSHGAAVHRSSARRRREHRAMEKEIPLWHRLPGFTFMSDEDVEKYRAEIADAQADGSAN
jgi:hypothetical protein